MARETETIHSTDDKRVEVASVSIDNIREGLGTPSVAAQRAMAMTYRPLTDDEKMNMSAVKLMGARLIDFLQVCGGNIGQLDNAGEPQMASRNLALARTHIEEAVRAAVKHITTH